MSTAFEHVVVEALDPAAQARWWADALGWRTTYADEEEVDIDAPEAEPHLRLAFVLAPSVTPNDRLHLDLASRDLTHQRELVDRQRSAAHEVPWEVLADPEGTVFCVLEPRPEYADTGAVAAVVLHAADPPALAAFWQAATGWQRADTALTALRSPAGGPFLEMYPVSTPADPLRHRLHLDVRPLPGSAQDAEVARLRALGASPLDVGQGHVPWQVLADPEGNAFCVLSTPSGASS